MTVEAAAPGDAKVRLWAIRLAESYGERPFAAWVRGRRGPLTLERIWAECPRGDWLMVVTFGVVPASSIVPGSPVADAAHACARAMAGFTEATWFMCMSDVHPSSGYEYAKLYAAIAAAFNARGRARDGITSRTEQLRCADLVRAFVPCPGEPT